ncbi:alpha/beta hydrolase [Sphingomonas oligophenolica]|uniref:Alpha/beta hydrolase n=1 Tax=Sphingomonas oligophenolica TaxID=301154 RepID=A0A502CP08_9SPHN|nr:alpha/beta hydrolase [Sphingomonas oligophenolica]TPG14618.1 alpha/beta hydrolase [Sphingomonas oligophenolica]
MRFLALLLLPIAAFACSAPAPTEARLLTWSDLTRRPRPTPDATVAYGTDPLQKGDLWIPQRKPNGNARPPVIIMIHGGCWQTDIADRTLMDWIADDLRHDGIAVWNIDYRGVDRPGGGYPGTFTDTGKAVDQLHAIAKKYHLDARRVVAIGHSAGGHLALWAAGRARLPASSPLRVAHPLRINHVISLGGLPDLEATAASPDNGCGTAVVARLVGPLDNNTRPDPYADTSVTRLLPLGVSQDLVNGREDHIIPYRLATGYVATATTAGDTAVLHTVPNTGHVELITPESTAWAETRRLIHAALLIPSPQGEE